MQGGRGVAPHDPDDRARSFFEDDGGAYASLIGQLDLPCRVPIALFPRAGQPRGVWSEDALAEVGDLHTGEPADIRATLELPRAARLNSSHNV